VTPPVFNSDPWEGGGPKVFHFNPILVPLSRMRSVVVEVIGTSDDIDFIVLRFLRSVNDETMNDINLPSFEVRKPHDNYPLDRRDRKKVMKFLKELPPYLWD
jgi:hypothetical protein